MSKRFTVTLFLLVLATPANADQDISEEEIETMVDRYVLGMGKIARKLLQDSGMAESDVERVSERLSVEVRECTLNAIEEESAGPVDVALSNESMESCVQTAFERAGISFP